MEQILDGDSDLTPRAAVQLRQEDVEAAVFGLSVPPSRPWRSRASTNTHARGQSAVEVMGYLVGRSAAVDVDVDGCIRVGPAELLVPEDDFDFLEEALQRVGVRVASRKGV